MWENPDYDIDEILSDTYQRNPSTSGNGDPLVNEATSSHSFGNKNDASQSAEPEDVGSCGAMQSPSNQAICIESIFNRNTIGGTRMPIIYGRPAYRSTQNVTQLLDSAVCTKASTPTLKGLPTTRNIPNFGKKVLVRHRKFPGPAGLLPDKPLDNFDASMLNVSESLCDAKANNLEEVVCSQGTTSNFTESPWLRLSSDFDLSSTSYLNKYNVAWIKRLAISRQLQGRKVPFLAVILKQIDNFCMDPAVVLEDRTGTINGTVHRNVMEEYGIQLRPGSALVLHQMGVVTTGFPARRHYLNITKNNVIAIYDCPYDEADNVRVTKVNEISSCQIIDRIHRESSCPKTSAELSPPIDVRSKSLFNAVPTRSVNMSTNHLGSRLLTESNGNSSCTNDTPFRIIRESVSVNHSFKAPAAGFEQLTHNAPNNKSAVERSSNWTPAIKKAACDIPSTSTSNSQFRPKVARFSNYGQSVLSSAISQDNKLPHADGTLTASSSSVTVGVPPPLSRGKTDLDPTPKWQFGNQSLQWPKSTETVPNSPHVLNSTVPSQPISIQTNSTDVDESVIESIFDGFDCSSLFEDF